MDLSGSLEYIKTVSRNRLANNQTPHQVREYGEGIELLGVAGEICARRFLGLPETLHEGFDGGCDLRYAGLRIDVKATVLTPNVKFRFLQWPEWKRIKSDIILLTAVDTLEKSGTVIGYATRAEIKSAKINRERTTPCYEISVRDLHPCWELTMEHERVLANGAFNASLS